MDETRYLCHRVLLHKSSTRWFAYVYPPSMQRALDEVLTATLAEGRATVLARARALIDGQRDAERT